MKKIFLFTTILAALLFTGCAKKTNKSSIAVFVPGIIDDSPTYNMLVQGIKAAVEEKNQTLSDDAKIELFVMEAGTNQAEWGAKLTALSAEQKYDVIISSNPSLPDLAEPILQQFPNQKFILLDAFKEGNPNIYTARYNQHEQAYLTGCMAAHMSTTKKIGLIAAQEYPVMNNVI